MRRWILAALAVLAMGGCLGPERPKRCCCYYDGGCHFDDLSCFGAAVSWCPNADAGVSDAAR